MNADRELLENAAKAAGLKLEIHENWTMDELPYFHLVEERGRLWNPLEDDGDEARLEACLQLHVEWHPASETVTVCTAEISCTEPYGDDRQVARKLAGVRAAAAIGAATK